MGCYWCKDGQAIKGDMVEGNLVFFVELHGDGVVVRAFCLVVYGWMVT
jgi:hypothetical protein